MKPSRSVRLTVIGLATVLTLTGCTLPGNLPLGSSPLIDGGTTIDKANRNASIRGSRLCVINNSTYAMSIFWRGYPDARDIPAGGSNCNSGYESGKTDVLADISYKESGDVEEVHTLTVSAGNGWLLGASAAATVDLNGRHRGVCGGFSVGETETVETGWLRGALTRLNDSADNVEFELTLTDNSGRPGGQYCT